MLCLALAVAGCSLTDQTPAYRYRLTVEVDTPDGVKTGSSVIEVDTEVAGGYSIPTPGRVTNRVRGEAVTVDLGEGRVLFALLLPASAAVNNVFTAKLMPSDVNSLSLTTGLMTLSALLLFILMMATDGLVPFTHAGLEGVWWTLWASAAIVVTYLCFFEILRRAGALFFAQLNYVVVAAGVLWAYLIFGDRPSVWLWAAIAAIALGLAVMNYSKAKTMRGADA